MAYLLIVPICLYIAVAATLLHVYPRSAANVVFALYATGAAFVTACYVVLGTTTDHSSAELAALLSLLGGSWAYVVLLPLTLSGLYFEHWLFEHRRRVFTASIATLLVIDVLLVVTRPIAGFRSVLPVTHSAWIPWYFGKVAFVWPYSALMLIGSQIVYAVIVSTALRHRRVSFWRGALPITAAAILSVLIPFLSPLAGANWLVTVAGLGYVPPVLLLVALFVLSTRPTTFDRVIQTTLRNASDGLVLLDADQRVIWHNAQVVHWLSQDPHSWIVPPHVFELLRGTPLLSVVRHMFDTGGTRDECQILRNGTEYMLRIEIRPLEGLRSQPRARLLLLRDVTTEHVRQDLQERREELLALSAISADIASSLDLDQVITRALNRVQSVTEAEGVAVYLLEGRHLRLAGHLIADQPPVSIPESFVFDPMTPNSPVNQALDTHRITTIADAISETLQGARLRSFGYRAGAFVPLVARDQLTGLLIVGYQGAHTFDSLEVTLLDGVGRQLAVAIHNAQLHAQERQQRRIAEVLREVAGIIANKSLDESLQLILERLRDILEYDRASVLVVAELGFLRIGASVGFEQPSDPQALRRIRVAIARFPYLERLFAERVAQIVPDTTQDDLWQPGDYTYNSWIAVPLMLRDQVLGCISLAHHQPGHFTHDDLQSANTFADQAAIAVENAQLFEIEQRRRVQAELSQQASYDLVTNPDIDSALTSSLHTLRQLISFDRAHVGLLEDEGRLWTFRAVYPPTDTVPLNHPLPSGNYPLVQRIISEKRPLLISETRENPLWKSGRLNNEEIRAWMGVPLIVRGKVIGLLSLDSWQPHRLLEEQLQIGQTFANQIAAALEGFRLMEETGRQSRAHKALNTILAASNEALTHENLLQEALERVLETLDMPGGAIHQYLPVTHELRLRAISGLPSDLDDPLERLPVTGLLSEFVLSPALLPGTRPCEFFSVPLVSHGTAIGLLSIVQAANQPITLDLQNLLLNIGQQLGVVMDNAILFEDTTRRATLSTDLARLSLAISAQLDRESVLDLICRESIGVFDVDGAYIWLARGSTLTGVVAHGPGAEAFVGHTIARNASHLLPVNVLDVWRPRYVHHAAESGLLPSDFLALTGTKAGLAIPLVKADVPVGTLLLVDVDRPDPFSDALADQVGVFGVQAALAIDNARLFDEVRRRLDQLRLVNEVGRYVTAILSEDALIEGVAMKLFDILHFEVISLLQVEDGELCVRAGMIRGGGSYDRPSEQHQSALVVAGLAYEQAEPALRNQTCHLISGQKEPFPCCSLGVPLIVADEVIGVLVVERRGYDTIVQEDLDVLEPLAAQLAVSLSNARLYDQVRQQALDLEVRVAQRTAEIRRQHERTEAILRSVADAVIVFDLHERVVMTNPMARSLYDGYDLTMDLGQRVRSLVQRVLLSQNGGAADVTEIIELGHVTLQAKASCVVEDNEILGSVVVLRDISLLQELDRMKDRFVQTVSHELRTPLANLKLYLSLLQKGRPERRETYLEVMEREVERLARLIGDLLEISRLQSEQRAERPHAYARLDMRPLIEAVVQDYTAWAESEHKELLHECLTPPLPALLGDPDQIERALTNLVSNAIRYTPAGGRITVRSRSETVEQSAKEWVIIEVIDTGIGIPEDELTTIFERFFRGSNVSPNIPGTGLGLAITREIVQLHGGTLEVESQEGHGSTFRMALPVLNR